uniref:Uncharacterized protein n=1 Tax=Hyaloperonospora arabidopsidis (strain Emoy2) TaxID=559515 RepID=M4BS51_HYAAE
MHTETKTSRPAFLFTGYVHRTGRLSGHCLMTSGIGSLWVAGSTVQVFHFPFCARVPSDPFKYSIEGSYLIRFSLCALYDLCAVRYCRSCPGFHGQNFAADGAQQLEHDTDDTKVQGVRVSDEEA